MSFQLTMEHVPYVVVYEYSLFNHLHSCLSDFNIESLGHLLVCMKLD